MKYSAEKIPFKIKFWLIAVAVVIVFILLFVFCWQWSSFCSKNTIKEELFYVSKNENCFFKYFSSKCYFNIDNTIYLLDLQDKKDNMYIFKSNDGYELNIIAVDENVIYNDKYNIYLYC